MTATLLHVHHVSPDHESNEYYLITGVSEEYLDREVLTKKIEKLEAQYCSETPEDEQTSYDMLDYVVEIMREQGYTMLWLSGADVVYRIYDWS